MHRVTQLANEGAGDTGRHSHFRVLPLSHSTAYSLYSCLIISCHLVCHIKEFYTLFYKESYSGKELKVTFICSGKNDASWATIQNKFPSVFCRRNCL